MSTKQFVPMSNSNVYQANTNGYFAAMCTKLKKSNVYQAYNNVYQANTNGYFAAMCTKLTPMATLQQCLPS
jgi:hypothetical protein